MSQTNVVEEPMSFQIIITPLFYFITLICFILIQGCNEHQDTRSATKKEKVYDKNTLQIKELIECLKFEEKLKQSQAKLNKYKNELTQLDNTIKKIETKISSLKNYIDSNEITSSSTQNAITLYNQKIKQYNQLISLNKKNNQYYNTSIERHNIYANLYRSQDKTYQSSCATKKHYPDDLEKAKDLLKKENNRSAQ